MAQSPPCQFERMSCMRSFRLYEIRGAPYYDTVDLRPRFTLPMSIKAIS
jgi:hypothetical protein